MNDAITAAAERRASGQRSRLMQRVQRIQAEREMISKNAEAHRESDSPKGPVAFVDQEGAKR